MDTSPSELISSMNAHVPRRDATPGQPTLGVGVTKSIAPKTCRCDRDTRSAYVSPPTARDASVSLASNAAHIVAFAANDATALVRTEAMVVAPPFVHEGARETPNYLIEATSS